METLADTRATLYTEAKDLLQWAFDSFAVRTVMEKGEIMEEVEVKYSFLTDHMPVATSETFMTLMPNGVDLTSIQMKYDLPEAIAAPVEKGLEIGRLHLILADEEIGSVPLMTTDSTRKNTVAPIVSATPTATRQSSLNSGPNRPLFLLRVLLRWLYLGMVLSLVRNWADCSRFTGGRFVKRPYGILRPRSVYGISRISAPRARRFLSRAW